MKHGPAQPRISSAVAEYDGLHHVGPESPCPYLPDLLWRNEAYLVEALDEPTYERLMDYGFRRSGRVVYRPRCRACQACKPVRVVTRTFRRTRSLRRMWAKNHDLRVSVAQPRITAEKYTLYSRYLEARHDDAMGRSFESFEGFLYDSPIRTLEFCYYLDGRLVGVSIADVCPTGLSSVYMYSEPALARRSLGTFSVLWEIDWCREMSLTYYYLGYYVEGSRTMSYKARFRPNEILAEAGRWVPFRS
jgi:arginine-tRNA-protein transferase